MSPGGDPLQTHHAIPLGQVGFSVIAARLPWRVARPSAVAGAT
jgi:hypothetical protein